jgi:release factor glutamine methyltransferase
MKFIKIRDLINNIAERLLYASGDKILAQQEAWWILQHVMQKCRHELLLLEKLEITSSFAEQLNLIIDQRVVENKPLAYVLGDVPFCNLNILVRPPTLIPRPETEEWVNWLILLLKNTSISKFCVLDLCCGSGCIGLALAKEFSKSDAIGIDISEAAIQLSNENKIHNHLSNIKFVQSNLFKNLHKNFKCDLIVSNPPYLAPFEYGGLDLDVKMWEDKMALVADDLGMKFYKEILMNAHKYLNKINTKIPQIIFEIGLAQTSIEKVLYDFNYKNFEIYKDMQGKNRWVAIYLD